MEIKAFAKTNLILNIVGREDGMHLLNMLVAQIDLYDEVSIEFEDSDEISCVMDGKPSGEDNSAVKAVRLLQAEYGACGAKIIIKKHIPFCSGLGGSTADGIAVFKAYSKEFGFNPDNSLLLKLGSDAPAMYRGGVCIVGGKGDKLISVEKRIKYSLGILVPEGGVSTAKAYALFDAENVKSRESDILEFLQTENPALISNDLESVSKKLNKGIAPAIEELKKLGAQAVCMSGSGSAVVGYFKGAIPQNNIKNLITTQIIQEKL